MNIGVICEGRSDYPAVTHFLGAALEKRGIQPKFEPLFPRFDRTRPDGGWANVLLWLDKNPPDFRVQNYFSGGLFSENLGRTPLNAIIMQMDSDVLEDASFRQFVSGNLQYVPPTSDDPLVRANAVREVLIRAAKLHEMTEQDAARHIPAPAVESTENWCVAAFHGQPRLWELLKGQDLIDAFMHALESSEGRTPQTNYTNIDKTFQRRNAYCERHKVGSERIFNSCPSFAEAITRLHEL